MTNALSFPLGYMAPVEWYAMFLARPGATIQTHETLPRQSIHTRCRIDGPQNTILLSVPVNDKGRVKMNEASISYKTRWVEEHLHALKSTYNNAPYFEFLEPDLERILQKKYDKLIDLNMALHLQIMKWLRIDRDVTRSESFQNYIDWPKNGAHPEIAIKPYPQIFRNDFTPGLSIIDALACEGAFIARNWVS